MIFLTLRLTCFLLTLIAKNTVHLGDGDIWLQLVVSFSNLGLRLSEELLTVEPARATGYPNNTSKQHNARTLPVRVTHRLHRFWSNRTINEFSAWGEKNPELFTCWWARKVKICLTCIAGVSRGQGLEAGRGGEFDTRGLVDDWNKLSQSHLTRKS